MLTPAGHPHVNMAENPTTQQLPNDFHDQDQKLFIQIITERTMKPILESISSSSESAKAAVDENENPGPESSRDTERVSVSEDLASKNPPKNFRENEKADVQLPSTLPPRPKVTRSNSYFEVKEGRPCVQRFRCLLDRNMAANPGCSH